LKSDGTEFDVDGNKASHSLMRRVMTAMSLQDSIFQQEDSSVKSALLCNAVLIAVTLISAGRISERHSTYLSNLLQPLVMNGCSNKMAASERLALRFCGFLASPRTNEY
jgi:hypothetical protein